MGLVDDSIDILYVEDDEADIRDVQEAFKKINNLINVAIARDGVQALNKLYGKQGEEKLDPTPKIIILDIYLPEMNGIELLKTLRTDPEFSHITVYVLTSALDTQKKLAMRDLHVSSYIIKPLFYADALNIFWTLMYEGD